MDGPGKLYLRSYGAHGPLAIVLHGGPGAAGSAAGLARGLASDFRVLEPWQRGGSGQQPLSVARHVADLDDVVLAHGGETPPALIAIPGGPWLALAYAAAHPDRSGRIVLVGCGTFDKAARARLQATLDERTVGELRRRLDRLPASFPDPAERLARMYELTMSLYSFDRARGVDEEGPSLDLRAHQETWTDMLRLQEDGTYPAAFAAIPRTRADAARRLRSASGAG